MIGTALWSSFFYFYGKGLGKPFKKPNTATARYHRGIAHHWLFNC